jgi:CRISPR system Cascade subunit CasC
VELGDDQPRTLANAFRKAVPLRDGGGDVFAAAMQALQTHVDQLDAAYGALTLRAQLSVTPPALAGLAPQPLAGLVVWMQAALAAGAAGALGTDVQAA